MIVPEGTPGTAFGTSSDGNPRLDDDARSRASVTLSIPSAWAWGRQVHGADVIVASEPGIGGEADALITTDPGLPVAVSVADCLPVALLADGGAAMAHAGWRGAAAGVVRATAEAMTGLGHPPHTMVIGPGIGPCCFEVGTEVAERFPAEVSTTSWDTISVDLGAAVATQASVPTVVLGACTHHDERFHSYRRDGTAERQFGVAWVPLG